jgi:hypothetical protein
MALLSFFLWIVHRKMKFYRLLGLDKIQFFLSGPPKNEIFQLFHKVQKFFLNTHFLFLVFKPLEDEYL